MRFSRLAVAAMACALSFPAFAADHYTIRVADSLSPSEPTNKAVNYFAEEVEKRTDGRVTVQVFPAQQLGSEKDVNAMMRQGANLISVTSSGYLSDFVPDMGILDGPYLFDDPKDHEKLIKSDWFKSIEDEFEKEGMVFVVKNQLFGARDIIADKPIRTPADIEGMTVRVPPNTVFIKTFDAMGARPTTVEWSETYSALQQNVVQAAEAPLGSLWGSKLYETRKVISMTKHFTAFNYWVINADYFHSLPEDIQKVLLEVGEKAGEFGTKVTMEEEQNYLDRFKEAGVKIVSDVDTDAFRKATASVYKAFPKWSPGLYERVEKILHD